MKNDSILHSDIQKRIFKSAVRHSFCKSKIFHFFLKIPIRARPGQCDIQVLCKIELKRKGKDKRREQKQVCPIIPPEVLRDVTRHGKKLKDKTQIKEFRIPGHCSFSHVLLQK